MDFGAFILFILVVLAFVGVAVHGVIAVVTRRRPRLPVGRLLFGMAAFLALVGGLIYKVYFLDEALVTAAMKGDAQAVKALLARGADPDAAWEDGRSALRCARANGNLQIIVLLKKAGAEESSPRERAVDLNTALVFAVENLQVDRVGELLRLGANPNARVDQTQNVPVLTEIVLQAKRENAARILRITEALLRAGMNPDAKGRDGVTALMAAAGGVLPERVAIMRILLTRHANVNATDAKGRTALMYAERGGNAAGVRLLLQHGADKRIQDQQGMTASMRVERDGEVHRVGKD